MVKTRDEVAVLIAMESLVIPRVGLAIKSASASSAGSVDGKVLKLDLSASTETSGKPQLNFSNRINSRTDWSKIDETRCKITNERCYLAVNQRLSDPKVNIRHMLLGQNKSSWSSSRVPLLAYSFSTWAHTTATHDWTAVARHHVTNVWRRQETITEGPKHFK